MEHNYGIKFRYRWKIRDMLVFMTWMVINKNGGARCSKIRVGPYRPLRLPRAARREMINDGNDDAHVITHL